MQHRSIDTHNTDRVNGIVNKLGVGLKSVSLLDFLIQDILDYSMINKGVFRLTPRGVYIEECVKDVFDLVDGIARDKGIRMSTNVDMDMSNAAAHGHFAVTDPKRFQQVLLNFINNSLKFTPKGGCINMRVEGTIRRPNCSFDAYLVSVSDDGVGIPKHVQPHLFTMFGTFDHNKGMNRHGIGLGLTITKKLIHQIGMPSQQVYLESDTGLGTKFTFEVFRNVVRATKDCEYAELLARSASSSVGSNGDDNNQAKLQYPPPIQDHYVIAAAQQPLRGDLHEWYHPNRVAPS